MYLEGEEAWSLVSGIAVFSQGLCIEGLGLALLGPLLLENFGTLPCTALVTPHHSLTKAMSLSWGRS
jgi:hypothetical protein